MPARPIIRFLYSYFIKFGFLDGVPGFHFCVLMSIYESMIVEKMAYSKRAVGVEGGAKLDDSKSA
jgi:hypothetical protein